MYLRLDSTILFWKRTKVFLETSLHHQKSHWKIGLRMTFIYTFHFSVSLSVLYKNEFFSFVNILESCWTFKCLSLLKGYSGSLFTTHLSDSDVIFRAFNYHFKIFWYGVLLKTRRIFCPYLFEVQRNDNWMITFNHLSINWVRCTYNLLNWNVNEL